MRYPDYRFRDQPERKAKFENGTPKQGVPGHNAFSLQNPA